VGFWLFLLYSAWHFGQSDALLIWNVLPKALGTSIAMSWGLMVISSIPMFHSTELAEVLPSWIVHTILRVTCYLYFECLGIL